MDAVPGGKDRSTWGGHPEKHSLPREVYVLALHGGVKVVDHRPAVACAPGLTCAPSAKASLFPLPFLRATPDSACCPLTPAPSRRSLRGDDPRSFHWIPRRRVSCENGELLWGHLEPVPPTGRLQIPGVVGGYSVKPRCPSGDIPRCSGPLLGRWDRARFMPAASTWCPGAGGLCGYAGASIEATRTSFLFTNSWMPRLASSRP